MSASLFDKYGGFACVSRIVHAFYEKAIDSDVIGPYFEDVDMRKLIDHQTKFIASVMGGPVSYSNEALRNVHRPHNIDRASFDEMAGLLRGTLEEFDLEESDVDRIMSDIESRAEIIISQPGT